MFKLTNYLALFLLGLFFTTDASAQQPEYKVFDNTGSSPIPLGSNTNNLSQFLITPADFDLTVPAGEITKIYVYIAITLNPPTVTFNNFKVRMGLVQDQNTPGSSPTINTNFYDSLKVVVPAQSKTFSTGGTWKEIQLDSAFYFDGTSSLIVEISQEGYNSGLSLKVNNNISFGNRQIYGPSANATGTSTTGRLNFGLDIIPVILPVAVDTLISDNSFECEGEKVISAVVTNNSGVTIDSFKLNWELNWVAQPSTLFTQTIPVGASDTVVLGTVNFLQNIPKNFRVWTTEPNGSLSNDAPNDTFSHNFVALNGLASASNILVTPVGNDSFQFSLQNPQNIVSYLWDFGDGTSSTLDNPGHTYAQPGAYTVTAIISNDCGSDTLSESIDNVSITDVTSGSFLSLYPNPAKNKLMIHSEGTAIERFTIFNILGQQVYKEHTGSQSYEVIITDFPSGIYTIQLMTQKGQVIRKFQKI